MTHPALPTTTTLPATDDVVGNPLDPAIVALATPDELADMVRDHVALVIGQERAADLCATIVRMAKDIVDHERAFVVSAFGTRDTLRLMAMIAENTIGEGRTGIGTLAVIDEITRLVASDAIDFVPIDHPSIRDGAIVASGRCDADVDADRFIRLDVRGDAFDHPFADKPKRSGYVVRLGPDDGHAHFGRLHPEDLPSGGFDHRAANAAPRSARRGRGGRR